MTVARTLRLLLSTLLLAALPLAGNADGSGFGAVSIPQPPKPAMAEACVEPVDVMRREHMNFLLHQRDATVIDGERGSRYSLTGCMDCHNPSADAETAVRYPDPQHFCAGCHAYASVKIDCFECHADRGLGEIEQGRLSIDTDPGLAALHTFKQQQEKPGGE